MRPAGIAIWTHAGLCLGLLFLIFITARGDLTLWIQLLFFTPPNAPRVAQNAQQQANPNYNAIPGQDASGNPVLYPNSTAQGAGTAGGAGIAPAPPGTNVPTFLQNFTQGFGNTGIGAILRGFRQHFRAEHGEMKGEQHR